MRCSSPFAIPDTAHPVGKRAGQPVGKQVPRKAYVSLAPLGHRPAPLHAVIAKYGVDSRSDVIRPCPFSCRSRASSGDWTRYRFPAGSRIYLPVGRPVKTARLPVIAIPRLRFRSLRRPPLLLTGSRVLRRPRSRLRYANVPVRPLLRLPPHPDPRKCCRGLRSRRAVCD